MKTRVAVWRRCLFERCDWRWVFSLVKVIRASLNRECIAAIAAKEMPLANQLEVGWGSILGSWSDP